MNVYVKKIGKKIRFQGKNKLHINNQNTIYDILHYIW